MTPAVAVVVCTGIAIMVLLMARWMVYEADRRADVAEAMLANADARVAELDGLVQRQAALIDQLRAHLADTSDGWVTYQRSREYRAPTAVQVIRVWEN